MAALELIDTRSLVINDTSILTKSEAKKPFIERFCLSANPRPCFTLEVLQGLNTFFNFNHTSSPSPVFKVVSSKIPGVFNLGGDLAHFVRLIERGEREQLLHYGRLCIDTIYGMLTSATRNCVSVALVQGRAFGGGMECALGADVIIAEKQAVFSLPETKFNLYPGMGALSILSRKISMATAMKMITEGRRYSAEAMFELGLVDILAEPGQGDKKLAEFINQTSRSSHALMAVNKYQAKYSSIPYQELLDVVTEWVDCAMTLSQYDIKVMQKLIKKQDMLFG